MNTCAVTVRLPLVTQRTVHGLESFIIVRMLQLHVDVATDAGIRAVSRRGEFGFVDEERNRLSRRIGFEKRVVRMTFEAVAIF